MGLLTGAAIGGGVTDGRLHSCYPWHRGGAYRELMSPADQETLRWILEFNKFDLYSKVWALQTVVSAAPCFATSFVLVLSWLVTVISRTVGCPFVSHF